MTDAKNHPAPGQASRQVKQRWERPTLEVLPITMTQNNATNTPVDGSFAPSVS